MLKDVAENLERLSAGAETPAREALAVPVAYWKRRGAFLVPAKEQNASTPAGTSPSRREMSGAMPTRLMSVPLGVWYLATVCREHVDRNLAIAASCFDSSSLTATYAPLRPPSRPRGPRSSG